MTSAAPDRHVSGAAADREAGRPRRGEGGRRASPAEDGDTSTAVPWLPFSGEDGVAQRGQAPAQGDLAKGQSQGGPAAPPAAPPCAVSGGRKARAKSAPGRGGRGRRPPHPSTALPAQPVRGRDPRALSQRWSGASVRKLRQQSPRPAPGAAPLSPRHAGRPATHQLLRPHVVQYPLRVLAVVPALHDGQQQLGGVILSGGEGGGDRESCWSGGRNAFQPMGQPRARHVTDHPQPDKGPTQTSGQVCGAGAGPERPV